MLKLALLVGAVLLGVSCRDANEASRAVEPPPLRPPVRFVLMPSDSVVVDASVAGQVSMLGCSEPPVGLTGFWLPAATELAALEAALPAWLESHISPVELPSGLPEIRLNRQYVGLYQSGRRVVLINAWRNDNGLGRALTSDQLFMSCGGGALNFRLLFDVAAKSFRDFQGNGPI